MEVDIAGFEKEMEIQRQTARGANPDDRRHFADAGGFCPSPRPPSSSATPRKIDAKAWRSAGSRRGRQAGNPGAGGQEATVADKTPFTPNRGQVDTGRSKWPEERLRHGHPAGRRVDPPFRRSRMDPFDGRSPRDRQRPPVSIRHHTATHLLHGPAGGPGVPASRRSLVAPDRLRFDFHFSRGLTSEEVQRVEDLVSEQVLEDIPVKSTEMALAAAKEKGAMSLFGEKYGDEVRVLEVGKFSLELCGGTHVSRTGEIGPVVVTAQSSVQAGVRRIEAVAGFAAFARPSASGMP